MNLSDIRKAKIPRKYKFPAGRGHSSGLGKQCGKGRKGQYIRPGTSFRPYFEGGQMPMLRRLPKRGFNNAAFKSHFEVVNLRDLEAAFGAGETVDEAALRAKGLVRRNGDGVKLLGAGNLTKRLTVKVHKAAAQAMEKVKKAGGSVELLLPPAPKKKKRTYAKGPQGKPASAKAPEGKPAKALADRPAKAPEGKPEGPKAENKPEKK